MMTNALNLAKARLWLLPLMLLLSLFTQTASAADTWLPSNFDANTHVYVDPALASHSRFPVALPGLEQKLKDAGNAQHLSFYFVMVEQGSEANGSRSGQKFGAWKLDQFAAQVQSKLPPDDYVLIMIVRSASDPSKLSMAAQGGNRLQKYGLDANWVNSPNGPLSRNRSTYLPNDPAGYAVAVASDINRGVSDHLAAVERAKQQAIAEAELARQEEIARIERAKQQAIDDARHAAEAQAFRDALPGRITIVVVPLSVLASLIVSMLLIASARKRLQQSIESWSSKFDNSNTNYLQLREAYFGFLQGQGTDWSKKFSGTTLATYTAAVKMYADLSARISIAQSLLEDARRAAKTSIFAPVKGVKVSGTVVVGTGLAVLLFFATNWIWALALAGCTIVAAVALASRSLLSALKKGYACLELDPIKVTGAELPIEERSFFGSIMEESNYPQPAALLNDMADLFDKTNKSLASIKKSFDGARQNRDEIDVLTKQVEEGKTRLEKAGLNFGPYEKAFAAIKQATDEFLKILTSDPMSAFEQSEEVEKDVKALGAKIDRAIKTMESLSGVEQAVSKARARASEVRAQDADYSYPEKDAKAADGAPKKTLLNEVGGNPDNNLAEADEHLKSAHAAVLAAELDLSDKEKQAALEQAAAATKLIDTVLAARAFVQKQVVPVRDNLGRLQGEIPGADKALSNLKSDFLAKNFEGEPNKLVRANSVVDKTEGELTKVRTAFMEQRYLAARKLLEGIGGDIQGARNLLVEIHSRLSALRQFRDHAKAALAQARQSANTLRDKLRSNSFTTSAATDDNYKRLLPTLSAQETDVAKQVTDWPAAADAADRLNSSFSAVDTAIDSERKAYELAGTRIDEVRAAVASAEGTVGNPDTREAARRKLDEARSALASLDGAYKVAKSDWNSLARKAESQKGLAAEAVKLALQDQELARKARQEVDAVDSRIRSLAIRNFTQTVAGYGNSRIISLGTSLDLSDASRHIGAANACLRNRDYEGARNEAARADASADSAEAWANAQLAAMAAEIMREWEAEDRRRREEEERRRQEEQRRQDEERRRQQEEDRRRQAEEDRRAEEQRRRDSDNDTSGRSGGGIDFGGGDGGGRSGGGVGDF